MNRAEIKFENDVLADILHVSEFGRYSLKLESAETLQPPKNSVDVLTMLFSLLEENSDTPAGRVYMGNQTEILHRTMCNLSEVIGAFISIEVTVVNTVQDEDGNITETKSVTNIAVTENATNETTEEEE